MSFKGESLEVPEVIEKFSFSNCMVGWGGVKPHIKISMVVFIFEVFPKFEKMVVWV